MPTAYLGEIAALLTAVCWTVSALGFEMVSKRVGSIIVNLLKLSLALVGLSVYAFFARGLPLPLDATPHAWLWLSLSGLAGFVLGDLFLFKAYTLIGSRIAMLVMATAPILTALLGWGLLGESLTPVTLLGIAITVGGIALVVLERNGEEKQLKLSHSPLGLLYAFGGAAGQALGLVLSKYGMGNYDPVAATQIRELAGLLGFVGLAILFKHLGRVPLTLRKPETRWPLLFSVLFGPMLGVTLSLFSVQRTNAAVAATLMAIVPVLIIPPAVLWFKEKINAKEVLGAVITVAGVAVLFYK